LEESASLFGLQLPDALTQPGADRPIDVWHENWPAVQLFQAMRTQLRAGFGGVEGFDYTALPIVERRLRLPRRSTRQAFDGLRVMEVELLRWLDKG
jgi:hypothetical protein